MTNKLIDSTCMNFRKDGSMVMHFSGGTEQIAKTSGCSPIYQPH